MKRWPMNEVWSARYNSYSAGARNEVPWVARKRHELLTCQFRPNL